MTVPARAALFFHLRFVNVFGTVEHVIACIVCEVDDLGPVGGDVLLDDLKAPSTFDHVATHEVFFERLREFFVAGAFQKIGRLTEQESTVPHIWWNEYR